MWKCECKNRWLSNNEIKIKWHQKTGKKFSYIISSGEKERERARESDKLLLHLADKLLPILCTITKHKIGTPMPPTKANKLKFFDSINKVNSINFLFAQPNNNRAESVSIWWRMGLGWEMFTREWVKEIARARTVLLIYSGERPISFPKQWGKVSIAWYGDIKREMSTVQMKRENENYDCNMKKRFIDLIRIVRSDKFTKASDCK